MWREFLPALRRYPIVMGLVFCFFVMVVLTLSYMTILDSRLIKIKTSDIVLMITLVFFLPWGYIAHGGLHSTHIDNRKRLFWLASGGIVGLFLIQMSFDQPFQWLFSLTLIIVPLIIGYFAAIMKLFFTGWWAFSRRYFF